MPRNKRKKPCECDEADAKKRQKKNTVCTECDDCKPQNCNNCKYCFDMPKNNGPGKLKKACKTKICQKRVSADVEQDHLPPVLGEQDLRQVGDDQPLLPVPGIGDQDLHQQDHLFPVGNSPVGANNGRATKFREQKRKLRNLVQNYENLSIEDYYALKFYNNELVL